MIIQLLTTASTLNKSIDETYWHYFKIYCKAQDDFRKVHLKDYHPDLAKEVYNGL